MVVVNIWYIHRVGAVTELALFNCTLTVVSILSSVWRHLFRLCAHCETEGAAGVDENESEGYVSLDRLSPLTLAKP